MGYAVVSIALSRWYKKSVSSRIPDALAEIAVLFFCGPLVILSSFKII